MSRPTWLTRSVIDPEPGSADGRYGFDEVAYGPRLKADGRNDQKQVGGFGGGRPSWRARIIRVCCPWAEAAFGCVGALALNPRTLILDEITNGQDDAIEKERMMQYLQTLNEERDHDRVDLLHDMDVVRHMKRGHCPKDGDLA